MWGFQVCLFNPAQRLERDEFRPCRLSFQASCFETVGQPLSRLASPAHWSVFTFWSRSTCWRFMTG